MRFDNGDLVKWSEDLWPEGRKERSGECRFAPNCLNGKGEGKPSFESCVLPAEFAERTGGEQVGGYARWTPLCRTRAEARWGRDQVEMVEGE